ncbi:DUF6042 family protein [Streptomyces sp. NPDC055632]
MSLPSREECIANARRVLDMARARIARERALGLLAPQVEFMLRRLERQQRGQPSIDGAAEESLLLHFAGLWSSHGPIYTSLRTLSQKLDWGTDELRAALDHLVGRSELRLYFARQELEDTRNLPVRRNFEVVADWQHINENRPRPAQLPS